MKTLKKKKARVLSCAAILCGLVLSAVGRARGEGMANLNSGAGEVPDSAPGLEDPGMTAGEGASAPPGVTPAAAEEREFTEEERAIPDDIELNNLLLMELKDGIVIIEMFPEKALGHVQRVSILVREGFYDGIKFHRVIRGFMAQTGDPTGTGMGGSKFGKMQAELNDMKHIRGTVSMARANDLDSANSQFFIITGKYFEHLDGQYTIWGRVIYGMELVDRIASSENDINGMVANPDVIVKMALMKDLNYNYEGDTEEQRKARRIARIEMLRSLGELKKLDSEGGPSGGKGECLLDKIIRLNGELE
ncbi:MAG: peptidylprolyl isomerase [Rickettsiales bacterium]|nr:peptidylprolyl isomerase [Rickettsiales bacterium]